MWGWLQERRKAGSYDYSGCMTCSRLLHIRDNRLIQLPVSELRELRSGRVWTAKGLEVDCREPYPLEGVTSPALDIEVILQRCDPFRTSHSCNKCCDQAFRCVSMQHEQGSVCQCQVGMNLRYGL